ncbi:helix-turn-helix domain-containing protein [Rhizobium sp. CB3060]|uniref:helix-turn-helix domain-containing protein n=1 Tax=Rhizobium sp. CB3060 TaxID=3138255 RepID=UPI0021A6DC63|nr:helix-turn-helix transcriptional regulator [Rhizobium tropici]UWU23018.1 helix-turn-helix domain-containing protein [Rhizobium tropici]
MKKHVNPVDASVGARVRLQRLMLGWSQQRLAQRIGVTFQQVQKYETGANRIGSSRLQMIADALAVPVAYFFLDGSTRAQPAENAVAIPDLEDLSAFLMSTEGASLNKAFMKIVDPAIRQSVLAMVKSLSEASKLPGADRADVHPTVAA